MQSYCNELSLQESVILNSVIDRDFLPIDGGDSMTNIWELGGRVVAPDDHVLDIIHRDPKTAGDLGLLGGNMLVKFQRIIVTIVVGDLVQ